jgi:hypothetical protein
MCIVPHTEIATQHSAPHALATIRVPLPIPAPSQPARNPTPTSGGYICPPPITLPPPSNIPLAAQRLPPQPSAQQHPLPTPCRSSASATAGSAARTPAVSLAVSHTRFGLPPIPHSAFPSSVPPVTPTPFPTLTPAPCYPELCGDLVHWACWYCRADLTIYAVPEEPAPEEEEASQASTSYSNRRRR